MVLEDEERLAESERDVGGRNDGVQVGVADDPIEGALEHLGDVEAVVDHTTETEPCDKT